MKKTVPDSRTLARRIACALGRTPCDLLLRNARLFNVFTKTWTEHCDIAVDSGTIVDVGTAIAARGAKEVDLAGAPVVPGFIDAHVHIESSMLRPAEFARLILSKGTTSIVADPHEIANVCGLDGIRFMIDDAKKACVDIFLMLPSCVPATPFETSGARLEAQDLLALMPEENVLGLAEVMNVPAVLAGSMDMLDKLAAAHRFGKLIDGHAPILAGAELSAYAAAGVASDHECSTAAEALDRVARGMTVFIREGSAGQNVQALAPAVTPGNAAQFCLCTDDSSPDDVSRRGHVNYVVSRAVGCGVALEDALCMATINTARHFGLRAKGALAPGFDADIVVLKDLDSFEPLRVYKAGVAADEIHAAPPAPPPESVLARVRLAELKPDAFDVACPSGMARVIGLVPGDLLTKSLVLPVAVNAAGCVEVGHCPGLVKVAVLERHHATGSIGLGLVRGLLSEGGHMNGAIATTVSHDAHNIIIAGDDDADMHCAAQALKASGGGMVLVRGGRVVEAIELEIAGLMTSADGPTMARRKTRFVETAHRDFGVAENVHPVMALSFLALPVIPNLRVTDKGLFDTQSLRCVTVDAGR